MSSPSPHFHDSTPKDIYRSARFRHQHDTKCMLVSHDSVYTQYHFMSPVPAWHCWSKSFMLSFWWMSTQVEWYIKQHYSCFAIFAYFASSPAPNIFSAFSHGRFKSWEKLNDWLSTLLKRTATRCLCRHLRYQMRTARTAAEGKHRRKCSLHVIGILVMHIAMSSPHALPQWFYYILIDLLLVAHGHRWNLSWGYGRCEA